VGDVTKGIALMVWILGGAGFVVVLLFSLSSGGLAFLPSITYLLSIGFSGLMLLILSEIIKLLTSISKSLRKMKKSENQKTISVDE
jgi:hypothetical protein